MSSEIDICNLALAHIGDAATVASLGPPEGSAQAEHCARFYPIARDSLLEMHTWGFSTRRVQLALLTNTWPEWTYAYAQPSDALNLIAVLPPDVTDDYSVGIAYGDAPQSAAGIYTPQPFCAEINENGDDIILTDQADAMLRYTSTVTDTTRFSPLFTVTLSWHLASMLAGPVIKGDAGAAESKRCIAMMQSYLSRAVTSDAQQRRTIPQHNVGWISGR